MKKTEDKHFWFVHKRRLINHFIGKYAKTDSLKVFDSGCGTGRDIYDFKDGIGMDISFNGLMLCGENCRMKVCGSVNEIPFKSSSFDVLLSMDVLQHEGVDEKNAVREYSRVLKKNGIVILNLPAIDSIYSYHDFSVETRHRYSRMEIKRLLKSDFEIMEMVFWNGIFFLPGVFSRTIISKLDSYVQKSDVSEVSKTTNLAGDIGLRIESIFTLSGILPVGFSLLTVGKKRNKRA
ncbi:MAG: class I SAM-dependent methyltransferase [bacterium]